MIGTEGKGFSPMEAGPSFSICQSPFYLFQDNELSDHRSPLWYGGPSLDSHGRHNHEAADATR